MPQARTLPLPLTREFRGHGQGLRNVLGLDAWDRLPAAVRERFADHAGAATYAGSFEVVHAHWLGQLFAWAALLFGMPVTPRAGTDVEARVRVRPGPQGVRWDREYLWADGVRHLVRSTKVVGEDAQLIERLPARLCMPLHAYEEGGVLHFVSLGYYFDLGFGLKLWLPGLFTPGITHVEHVDLDHGWFRFTMAVTHPLFGQMFFQTGRFCAAEETA